MKSIITLILFFTLPLTALAQLSDTAMMNFDLKKFISLKKLGLDSYYLEDSAKVSLVESNSGYGLSILQHNSDYSKHYVYFNSTLTLKSYCETFKRVNIGTGRKYDERGNMIEEENYDTPFVFTLQDLHKKLLLNYHIDIMDFKQKIGVSRFTRFCTVYDVSWYLSDNVRGEFRTLRIDGLNGIIILDEIKQYECKTK